MSRRLVITFIAGCSQAASPPSEPTRPGPTVTTTAAPTVAPALVPPVPSVDAGVTPTLIDAGAALASATPVLPLPLSGPYRTLLASCQAARPCGFSDLDPKTGSEIKPATKPICDAVLDPSIDIVASLPQGMATEANSGRPQMIHKTATGEIRVGGVRCAVPEGLRFDHSEYYVFVKRADGWWRTTSAIYTYDYNNKYCGGSTYIHWNDKPTRTIAGIAAGYGCLVCDKAGEETETLEMMLRVETVGATPIVFTPLAVGERSKVTVLDKQYAPKDCKASASSSSLKENWVSDDEVILEGPAISGKAGTSGLAGFGTFSVPSTVGPGMYRFTR